MFIRRQICTVGRRMTYARWQSTARVRSAAAPTPRISRHCSMPLRWQISNPAGDKLSLGAQPLATTYSSCPNSVRLQIGEPSHSERPHNSHSFLLGCTHYVPIHFPVNKASLVIVPFCFFVGLIRGWGVLVERNTLFYKPKLRSIED